MSSGRSWSTDQVKSGLEESLTDLHRLEEHLPEPLTLTESIAELEATIAAYNRVELNPREGDDA